MKKNYLAPSIEEVRVEVEKGFATSGSIIPQENTYAKSGLCGMLQEGDVHNF